MIVINEYVLVRICFGESELPDIAEGSTPRLTNDRWIHACSCSLVSHESVCYVLHSLIPRLYSNAGSHMYGIYATNFAIFNALRILLEIGFSSVS